MKTKKIFSLAIAILLSYSFTACKPDNNEPQPPLKSYADVTLADIKAKETLMTTNDIVVSDANGIKLKSGDIFFYKTNKAAHLPFFQQQFAGFVSLCFQFGIQKIQ